MTITTLIALNAVLAAAVLTGILLLHAHGIRHDRRHALRHRRSLRAVEAESYRERIAA